MATPPDPVGPLRGDAAAAPGQVDLSQGGADCGDGRRRELGRGLSRCRRYSLNDGGRRDARRPHRRRRRDRGGDPDCRRRPARGGGGEHDFGILGSLLRLLPGWQAGQPGGRWELDGDDSIRRRPVDRIVEPLRRMGASLDCREGRLPPARGGGLRPLSGSSTSSPSRALQVKSCLLLGEGARRGRDHRRGAAAESQPPPPPPLSRHRRMLHRWRHHARAAGATVWTGAGSPSRPTSPPPPFPWSAPCWFRAVTSP